VALPFFIDSFWRENSGIARSVVRTPPSEISARAFPFQDSFEEKRLLGARERFRLGKLVC
jgi:hypothetical protein